MSFRPPAESLNNTDHEISRLKVTAGGEGCFPATCSPLGPVPDDELARLPDNGNIICKVDDLTR
jgi:hypothetical protein